MARRKDQLRRLQAEARQAERRARARDAATRRAASAAVRPRKQSDTLLRAIDDVLAGRGVHSSMGLTLRRLAGVRGHNRLLRFRGLVATVEPRARRMVSRFLVELWELSTRVAADSAWRPKSRAPAAQFRSFVDHHLVQWAVPCSMYQCFGTSDGGWPRGDQVNLFFHLTRGGSLRSTYMPIPLTRRQQHAFRVLPDRSTPLEAMRKVQVLDAGGSAGLARAVVESRLGRAAGHEAYASVLIGFLVRKPDLELVEVGPLVDFLLDRRPRLGGRCLRTLRGEMVEWHVRMRHARDFGELPERFASAGIAPLDWMLRVNGRPARWTTREILTPQALAQEGRAMHHCVWSYLRRIVSGDVSIHSLGLDGRRRCTIEVRNGPRQIVQVRGLQNRLADREERVAIRRWAEAAGLSLRA